MGDVSRGHIQVIFKVLALTLVAVHYVITNARMNEQMDHIHITSGMWTNQEL